MKLEKDTEEVLEGSCDQMPTLEDQFKTHDNAVFRTQDSADFLETNCNLNMMVTNTDLDKKPSGVLVGDPQQPNFFNQPQQADLDMLNTSLDKNSDAENGFESDQDNKKNGTENPPDGSVG